VWGGGGMILRGEPDRNRQNADY